MHKVSSGSLVEVGLLLILGKKVLTSQMATAGFATCSAIYSLSTIGRVKKGEVNRHDPRSP